MIVAKVLLSFFVLYILASCCAALTAILIIALPLYYLSTRLRQL